jgi:hypothetical protein
MICLVEQALIVEAVLEEASSFVAKFSTLLLYYEASQESRDSLSLVWSRNHSSVVGSCGNSDITGLGDVLDNNLSASFGRDANPCRCGATTRADLKEIVGGSGGSLPCLAGIDANLELGGAELGVDDLSREPVLRNTGLHVDGKRSSDGARNIVPSDSNHAGRFGGQVGESVLVKVEVVGTTPRALVGDHCSDALAVGTFHADAGATLICITPVGVRESSSVDSRGESVLSERTLTAGGVTTVESSLTRQSALGDSVGVG